MKKVVLFLCAIFSVITTFGQVSVKKPFLALSFSDYGISSRPDKNDYYQILVAWYNTGPTEASTQGYFQFCQQRRQDILAVNPKVVLGVYYSAITAQNPTSISDYIYPADNYDLGNFVCDDPANSGQYDPRPDDFGFFSPLWLTQKTSWEPWKPGVFGRWPFYYFQQHGWILPQTTYICRPIIDVRSQDVINFVSVACVDALNVRHPYANAITLDNAALYKNQYDRWPGFGETLSPYRVLAPDADFFAYLDRVRAALHMYNYKLMVNPSGLRPIAPHADVLFWEGGIQRSHTSAAIDTFLYDSQYAVSLGDTVVQRFIHNGGLESNNDDLMFFLATSLLVYENGKFGVDLMLSDSELLLLNKYIYLPTWMGDPIEPFNEMMPNFYIRRFQNGVVYLNTNSHRMSLSQAQYDNLQLASYGAPIAISSKSGVIVLKSCNINPACDSCTQLYKSAIYNPPIKAGDLNCDEAVNDADYNLFNMAITNVAQYNATYPYCDRMAGDMNHDGILNQTDKDILYYTIFHDGNPPVIGLHGDMNCDGYINNFDIDPFVTALLDPAGYAIAYPNCDRHLADLDNDGLVTNFDIDIFVNRVLAGH